MKGRITRWERMPDVTAFIEANYRGLLTKDLTDLVNAEFGTSFSRSQVDSYLDFRKMRSGVGRSHKGTHTLWKPELDAYVAANKDRPNSEVAAELSERLGRRITESAVSHRKSRIGVRSVNDGRIKPGEHKGAEYQYKPGNVPLVTMPVGTEIVRSGYVYVKVTGERYLKQYEVWKPKARVIWAEENGPIPPGMAVVFRDGDPMNLDIGNLQLVSLEERAYQMHMGLRDMEPELRPVGELVAKAMGDARRREKNEADVK